MAEKKNNSDGLPEGKPMIDWKSSKEEQWGLLNKRLEEKPASRQVFWTTPLIRYAAAATVSLLLIAGLFAGLYSIETITHNSERTSVELPDGSRVYLNAGTSLSYKPYWWWMDRSVHLNGEAYFEVEKGGAFRAISETGITRVLGTEFNIYARGTEYRVACYEGSVNVMISDNTFIDLQPGQSALREGDRIVLVDSELKTNDASWRNNLYIFTAAEIAEVIDELERQYDVTIQYLGNPATYTGSFRQEMKIDEVLDALTMSLGLQWEKSSDASFIIRQK